MSFKIEWAGTPNYRQGRRGKKTNSHRQPHHSRTLSGLPNWMQNPKAQASANYLVTKGGHILQLVKDEDTAWANGVANKPNWQLYDGTNPNYYTISIEHEALCSFWRGANRSAVSGYLVAS